MFALALAKPLPRYFQGDVLPQQPGMEMPLLWGEYHQKHLSALGRAQSGASPAGKERREVKDKLKLERKLNMLFRRTSLALICQFYSTTPASHRHRGSVSISSGWWGQGDPWWPNLL